jgi:hypothetical protein
MSETNIILDLREGDKILPLIKKPGEPGFYIVYFFCQTLNSSVSRSKAASEGLVPWV